MKKLFRIVSILLVMAMLPVVAFAQILEEQNHTETLQQPTDVFEVTDDGRKMRIVTVLDEGTEYEPIERIVTQDSTAFDSYFYSNSPIEWIRISYHDRKGSLQQGWIVANTEAITGINMSVFDNTSNEEYNGYDLGFVLCETLSLRENPDATSRIIQTMTYGTYCTVIEEIGSWYNVTYRDESLRYSGWVRKEYVLVNPDYFVPDGETPVYAMPSGSSKRVGLINNEARYPIIGEINGFLVISLRGASGFVSKP